MLMVMKMMMMMIIIIIINKWKKKGWKKKEIIFVNLLYLFLMKNMLNITYKKTKDTIKQIKHKINTQKNNMNEFKKTVILSINL